MRIRAGNARTYYIGLPSDHRLQGICVLPAGVEEGTTLPLLNREFSVLANRPVSFTLYSSRTRHDAHGEVAVLDEANVHRHPPLVTLLRYGKKMRDVYLTIRLRASFTEVGTLELWCESQQTPHRWRLQFELRDEEAQAQQLDTVKAQPVVARSSGVTTSDATVESAAQLIKNVFGDSAPDASLAPEALVGQMEAVLGCKKRLVARLDDSPVRPMRLSRLPLAAKSPPAMRCVGLIYLASVCVRDSARRVMMCASTSLRTIASNNLAFADDLQCQVGALVLLRRIAGGIHANEQLALYRNHTSPSGSKKKRINRQLEYEKWRLLGNLEHLQASIRASLGRELLAKVRKEPGDAIWLWSLGRLGARIPLYGPLHSVVEPEIASEWLKALLDLSTLTAVTDSTVVLIARRIDDRSRDIDEAMREQAISRFMALGITEETIRLVSRYVPPERADAVRSFGESLPPGLQAVSSSNCLLSVPALHISGPSLSTPA